MHQAQKKLPKADDGEGTMGRPQLLCRPRYKVMIVIMIMNGEIMAS